MSNLNSAVYAEGCFYPSPGDTISQIQESGFTTLILSLFHIGRDYDIKTPQIMGDIYFNDTKIISQGTYTGDPGWPALINSVIGGTVTKVCASIGGGGVQDYETIQKIYEDGSNSFSGTNLETCFAAFRKTFPSISIIDMDCEETYDQESFVAFCQMLIGMGFGITFCPYDTFEQSFWVGSLEALNKSNPGAVKWWNLQCYDGGSGNDPQNWADSITATISSFNTNDFILAGDWTNAEAYGVKQLMKTFSEESCVAGGFIWTLDNIIKQYPHDPLTGMKAYANAISTGLTVANPA